MVIAHKPGHMPSITFDSLAAANSVRSTYSSYIAETDDKRSTTVKLSASAPNSVVERVRERSFESIERSNVGAGSAKLSESERQSLQRQHSGFDWQSHGFQAMSAKSALQERGVDTWMDYYEPGESVESSVSKLRSAKGSGGRASLGIEGMRSDVEEDDMGRRARQSEQVSGRRVQSAKEPAIFDADDDAIDFLREEEELEGNPWDISFTTADKFGIPQAGGRDSDLLKDKHSDRSQRAQTVDEQNSAPITRDPIKWSQNMDEYDYPGIDTVDPEQKHAARSDKAKAVDENELAPIADNARQWAKDMDEFDLPGVDTPSDDPF